MLKIFVTGDNHIGLKYGKYEEKAEKLAACRIDAFDSMVEKANQEECDLFVITGDLFQKRTGIAKKDIKAVMAKLADFQGTVAVLPGNHDYYDAEAPKVWKDFEEVCGHNVLLLKEERAYNVPVGDETAVLYPALCKTGTSSENNLGWIKAATIPQDGAYHIGIAHGAVEGETIDSEGKYFRMNRKELGDIPVDVWLLGHTHVPFPKDLTEEFEPCEKILNPGTHVQTDVNCNTDGLCFIVEIDEQKQLQAKKFASGNMRFYRKTVNVHAGTMEEEIRRAVKECDEQSVVELILQGAVTDEEYENREAIASQAVARFVEGKCDTSEVCRQITRKNIEEEFPEMSFAAQLLTALLDDPKEAQMAYDLLQTLKEDK